MTCKPTQGRDYLRYCHMFQPSCQVCAPVGSTRVAKRAHATSGGPYPLLREEPAKAQPINQRTRDQSRYAYGFRWAKPLVDPFWALSP